MEPSQIDYAQRLDKNKRIYSSMREAETKRTNSFISRDISNLTRTMLTGLEWRAGNRELDSFDMPQKAFSLLPTANQTRRLSVSLLSGSRINVGTSAAGVQWPRHLCACFIGKEFTSALMRKSSFALLFVFV